MSSTLCRTLTLGLMLCGAFAAYGKPPEAKRIEEIGAMLPAEARGVGRPIDDRRAWDALAKTPGAGKIIKDAERMVGRAMPELADESYLEYSRNGNRSRCQGLMNRRHGRLEPLVLAECLENRGRFLPEIERVIKAICDEKTWVLPAHDRNLTNFKGTEITVDLRSGAVGWDLATVDYWLGKRLSPGVRRRIAEELERRIFAPYEKMVKEGKPRMWWLVGTNNWNAVCLANVTGAALGHIKSRERRAFYVASAEKYIQYFLKGFTSDGYCSEGLGYWNYGFGHFVLLAETLMQATGGKVDLMADPRVPAIARFGRRMEITSGVYPAFADCDVDARPAGWIQWYAGARCEPERLVGRAATLALGVAGGLPGTGLWCFPNSVGRAAKPGDGRVVMMAPPRQPLRDWFDEAGVLICRPRLGPGRPFGAALKDGHNAENHNHNDVGSYVVVLGRRPLLVDPGAEEYTRRTFSEKRYTSGVLNSWGHSVPLVAGQMQRTGRSAAAKVVKADFSDGADTLVLDIRSAYDVETLEELTRTFVFSRSGEGSLTVTDHVVFSRPERFGTASITFDPWKRTGRETLRVGEGKTAVDVRIDAAGEPFGVKAETIKEDLPGGRLPTRLGIDLDRPVREATVRVTIRPAG
jgi:hypothetical protein